MIETLSEVVIFSIIEEELRLDPPIHLEGWSTPEKGKRMAALVLEHKPETIVEIGVFGGRSAIAMALACRENGVGKVYGIDPWKLAVAVEGEKDPANVEWWTRNVDLHAIHKGTMEAIWRLGLDDWIVIIRSASQRVPHLFPGGIQVLSIDGNHSEESSCRDVNLYLPMVSRGGHIWFDDSDWPSTQKAVSVLSECCDLVEDYRTYRLYRRR